MRNGISKRVAEKRVHSAYVGDEFNMDLVNELYFIGEQLKRIADKMTGSEKKVKGVKIK